MKKTNELLYEVAKERYNHELNLEEKIDSNLSLPIFIITLLVGAIAYYIDKLPVIDINILIIGYYTFFFLFCVSLLSAIYYSFRTLTGYKYAYIPTPKELNDYIESLVSYYNTINETDIDGNIEQDINNHLLNVYIRTSENNFLNNVEKYAYLFRLRIFIVASLIFLFISYLFFYFIQ